jgi:hypothetical protein
MAPAGKAPWTSSVVRPGDCLIPTSTHSSTTNVGASWINPKVLSSYYFDNIGFYLSFKMSNHPEPAVGPSTAQSEQSEQNASVQKIQSLLKVKDDTSRFVGLALLKSVLDNSQELREDQGTMATLWESIPPKFLDRMIRTGSRPNTARSDGHHMLDIVIAILHTFVSLLPEKLAKDGKMLDRIPHLVACLLHWYGINPLNIPPRAHTEQK